MAKTVTMISHQLAVDKEDFWANVVSAQEKWNDGVPLDIVRYLCCKCKVSFEMNPDGLFIFDEPLEKKICEILNDLQTFSMEEHIYECSANCSPEDITLDPDFGCPENLLFFFPETKRMKLTTLILGNESYEPDVLIQSKEEEVNVKPISTLYQTISSQILTWKQVQRTLKI